MTMETTRIDRRAVLRATGLGLIAGSTLLFLPRRAGATPQAAQKLLGTLSGGKTPKSGKVKITMPQIAENGKAVPVTVSVESPMTGKDHVKAIHIVAEANPDPDVVSFQLTPMSGKAEISTRMRLAKTQKVIALAEMSDGSLYTASTEVKVTIGGCGG
jgi:sulfur-oxidizing protein SoxY